MVSPTPSFSPHAPRPQKQLLIAWTLLLLDAGATHGYKLHHMLQARGLDLQTTSLYRWLRAFERDRWVASRWSEPVDGPRRHVYRLTPQGRAALHELTARIAAMRDTYSTFLDAHEHAVTRRVTSAADIDDAATPAPHERDPPTPAATPQVSPPPSPQPLRPHKELLAGWLLLQLDAGATYGYDLRREFDAHRLTTDPATVYRMLRRLEADTWVQSRWMQSAAGPRRRFYRLTARGRRNLDEIAGLIAAMRDAHNTYLHAYEHPRQRDP